MSKKKDREVILVYYDLDGNPTNHTIRYTLYDNGLSCNGNKTETSNK